MKWLWWGDYQIELTILLMPSGLKLVAIRAMLYILSDALDHLIHVDAFTEMINDAVDPSMLFVIMCHFKHFRVTVLWDAESLLMMAVRPCKVINIVDQVMI